MEVEIYFDDLKPDKQNEILELFGTGIEDTNWDVFPLTIITTEEVENGA